MHNNNSLIYSFMTITNKDYYFDDILSALTFSNHFQSTFTSKKYDYYNLRRTM